MYIVKRILLENSVLHSHTSVLLIYFETFDYNNKRLTLPSNCGFLVAKRITELFECIELEMRSLTAQNKTY